MTQDAKAIEKLARAYDREDASQRGEPDPWEDGNADAAWVAERLACASAALSALRDGEATEGEAIAQECATEGCGQAASVHFIRGNVGSYFCQACYKRVHACETGRLAALRSAEPVAQCQRCKGNGTVADYIGDDMRCVEAECDLCGGKQP